MNEKSVSENKTPFYYSLSSACDIFDFKAREILDLAINGDIVLSVKIPEGYSPYLMSVVDTETQKAFGFLTNTKKALANISMLPKAVSCSHLNLSIKDCEILKTSNLEQSIFGSAFIDGARSALQNEMVNQSSNFIYEVQLGHFTVNIVEHDKGLNSDLKKEIESNFSSKNIERLMNGFHAVWSRKYLRKFVLINDESELNDPSDSEYLASSTLNPSMIKAITITQYDIVISSNYSEILERSRLTFSQPDELEIPPKKSDITQSKKVTIDDIPVESEYYIPSDCRYSSNLISVAILGYCFFEEECINAPDNLAAYIQDELGMTKREAETSAFFINPIPSGKMKADLKGKVQFQSLIEIHKKYYSNGKPKEVDNLKTLAQRIKNAFGDSFGYAEDKCRYAVKLITPEN